MHLQYSFDICCLLFKMISPRNVELSPYIGAFPVFRCSNIHTYSTLIGEENEMLYSLYQCHLEYEQLIGKGNEIIFKKNGGEERERIVRT